jgi:adenylate cyclase
LFTDFVGFTRYAESLAPEKLVESIDFYFSKFDEIIETHGLEKIKTIGDAYMSAGGLEDPTSDHASRMLKAAFDILEFVNASKTKNDNDNTRFDIRIGINTGPVVAGVVGTKKFSYDIWGDSVNIASRMESNSEPGKINISHSTYNYIKDDYDCEFRGKLKVKNRGEMRMYWVHASKNVL